MAVCTVCQRVNPVGAEYCEDCGAALPLPQTGSEPASSQPQSPSTAVAPESRSSPQSGAEAVPAASGVASAPSGATSGAPTNAPAGPSSDGAQSASGAVYPRLMAKRFGALTNEEIPLQGERMLIGRFDPETGPVDIDLSTTPEADQISRQHGEVYRDGDGTWLVRDLGSTNGVFVKHPSDQAFGPRITEPRRLENGDEVAFGNARFIFKAA